VLLDSEEGGFEASKFTSELAVLADIDLPFLDDEVVLLEALWGVVLAVVMETSPEEEKESPALPPFVTSEAVGAPPV